MGNPIKRLMQIKEQQLSLENIRTELLIRIYAEVIKWNLQKKTGKVTKNK